MASGSGFATGGTVIFPAPMDAGNHRVNVGIANAGPATQSFHLEAIDAAGTPVTPWDVEVGPFAIEQLRTNAGMSAAGSVSVSCVAGCDGNAYGYASVVVNDSNDAYFLYAGAGEGTVQYPPVMTVRDDKGVFFITGGSLYDVFDAFGYAVATDRLWQMEQYRRAATGRLAERRGAFVTLHARGELRGCIGTFDPEGPLPETIREFAVASSLRDRRFRPVTASLWDPHQRVAELGAEIRTLLASGPACAGYRVPRLSRYLGAWVRSTDWYPDWQLRFYDRTRASWNTRPVHESVDCRGPVARLRGELQHHAYRDIAHHLDTINRYTTLAAGQLAAEGRRSGPARATAHAAAAFLRNYLLRRGVTDGAAGFVVSGMNAYYVWLKLVKLWALRHEGLLPPGPAGPAGQHGPR